MKIRRLLHDLLATHIYDWDEAPHDGYWVGTCKCGDSRREEIASNGPYQNPNPRYSPLR